MSEDDPAALALPADVVGSAASPARRLAAEQLTKPDGRALTLYRVTDDAS